MNWSDYENFSEWEFQCKCDGLCDRSTVQISEDLVAGLQEIRDYFGERVDVTSGVRCTEHNLIEGGKPDSRHLYGLAADIQVEALSPLEVAEYAQTLPVFNVCGIGLYDTFVHLDVRGRRARWDYRSGQEEWPFD